MNEQNFNDGQVPVLEPQQTLIGAWELVGQTFKFVHQNWKSLLKSIAIPFLISLTIVVCLFLSSDYVLGLGLSHNLVYRIFVFIAQSTLVSFVALPLFVCVYEIIFKLEEKSSPLFIYRRSFDIFLPLFLTQILCFLVTLGSSIFLIIPGIFFAIATLFYIFFVVSRKARGMDSCVLSWSIVRGRWWKVIGRIVLMELTVLIPLVGILIILGIASATLIPLVVFLVAKFVSSTVISAVIYYFFFILAISLFVALELFFMFIIVSNIGLLFKSLLKTATPVDESWKKRKRITLWFFAALGIIVFGLFQIFLIPRIENWEKTLLTNRHSSVKRDDSQISFEQKIAPAVPKVEAPHSVIDKSLLQPAVYIDKVFAFKINLPINWQKAVKENGSKNEISFVSKDSNVLADLNVYSDVVARVLTPEEEEGFLDVVRDGVILNNPGFALVGRGNRFMEYTITDPTIANSATVKGQMYFHFTKDRVYVVTIRAFSSDADKLLNLLNMSVQTFGAEIK